MVFEFHSDRNLKAVMLVWAGVLLSAFAIGKMGVQRPILMIGVIGIFLMAGLIRLSPVTAAVMIFAMVLVHMNRVIAIPVIGVAPNYTVSEWFLLGVFGVLLIDRIVRKNLYFGRIPLLIPMILWAAAIFVSGSKQGLFVALRGRLVTIVTEGSPILAYLAVLWLLRNREQVRRVISGMIFLGAAISVWGLIQYFSGNYTQLTPGGIPRLGLPVQYRIGFNGSIGACSFISLVLPLVLQRLIDAKSHVSKLHYFSFTCLFLATAFLTFARGGWLGIVAGFLIFFFQSERKRKEKIIILIILIFLGLYCTGMMSLLQVRLIGETIQELGGGIEDSGRHLLMRTALEAFATNPVTGIGIGSFADYNYRYGYFYLPLEKQYCDAHNYFLQVIAESGLLGLAALLAVLFLFFRAVRRAMQSDALDLSRKRMLQALLVGLVSFLLTNLSNYNVGTNAMRLLIGFYMGLMIVLVETGKPDSKSIAHDE